MPLNSKKIVEILLEECKNVDERCDGYGEEIVELVSDIIKEESQHRVQGTNIQQKITDKCKASGRLLATQLNKDQSSNR